MTHRLFIVRWHVEALLIPPAHNTVRNRVKEQSKTMYQLKKTSPTNVELKTAAAAIDAVRALTSSSA